mmetsp:Transcript_10568/g.23288  ORF Transcript_10568/g.23288 Transcript_10568/m.23288 type:complete len:257 (-) Transcript_10568:201-971(-)|eukprot:CAMPEP_0206458562 /NCGR_PEP_ID=MMETSP0324_2-20121206/23645_1 /ASSEMBLY_ACC=CAM_ASM_000836 /TAXON_ID=2866 /ORGANISM="Crypthecodinium cohnii, Strain Seligo" /LENGTH=256 /DNA_ID=CAMNT_0053929927 /DNA_START=145 /DNA_END=915 /DNA_ORIENTATION=+
MPATYMSSGVFPGQTAIKSISQADLRKLTYGTTYKAGVPGKVMREEDKWENFIDIHDVGKKDTKYMKVQQNEAPLLDRSSCTNRRDFVELPLGDNIINAALADNFKKGFKGGAAGLDASAKNNSAYKDEFAGYSPERARGARLKSCKPKQSRTHTITSMTDMLETRPMSHVAFNIPEASLAKAAEIVLAKPNLSLGGDWNTIPKTSYKQFSEGSLKPSASQPQLGSREFTGEEAKLLPDNHPSHTMRRLCYMSPGQ